MTAIDSGGGPQSPLVTVIVRTTRRPELTEALESIARQTYRPLEVVLVDASGQGLPDHSILPDLIQVTPVSHGEHLPRPVAANLGLQASHGDLLLLLDEDDWISPGHLSNLVRALQDRQDIKAAYSSTRKTDSRGRPLDEVFDRDYDPVLLKRDNYIPIHAMLFSRELVAAGCEFDESLDIYEDWDFWLQLSRQTDFLHLDEVSAFYRQGGGSATDISDQELRYSGDNPFANARRAVYRKWLPRWSSEEINELIGRTVPRDEFDLLAREMSESAQQIQEMNAYAGSLRAMLDKSTQEAANLTREADELRKTLHKLKREHALSDLHRDRHLRDLESSLNEIYALPSWRLMGPFRRLKRQLDQALLFPLKQKIHYRRYGTELKAPVTGLEAGSVLEEEFSAPELQEDVKSRYREEAAANLQRFFDSGSTLVIPKTEQPRVSILLVLYNQAPLTLLCIESILKFAPAPYELVIVNNASSDESGQLLERLANATVIQNADNEGFVKAVNRGVEACRGRYLLLLNNDAMLHLYAIESAMETLQNTPDAGAVGGRILLLDGSLQEAGSIIFSNGSCLGYGRHGDPDAPEFQFRREVDYCSGAFLLCETALFRQLEGFDLDYAPAYYEDSDFCIRLQKQGLKVIYDPGAVITHYEFASSGGQHKASQLQDKHRQVLLAKHGDYLAGQPEADARSPLFCRSANRNPNILVIDDRVPHASLGSGYPRCREMLTLLAAEGFNVTLYPLQFPEESWKATYSSLPGNVEVMLDRGLQGLAAFLARRRGFYRTLLVSRIHNMQYLNGVLADDPTLLENVTLIYDAEAITAPREILQRELQGEQFTDQQKFDLIEQEISAARTANAIVAVSRQEAEIYAGHGFSNTVVLGHSLPPRPTENTFEQRRDLLFVGALRDDDSPNVDSLHWFVSSVWPQLRRADPALKLHVVGDNEAPSLQQLDVEGIEFHGRLDDLGSLYNQARAFIAPTRFAAGIPHKVHEAAAYGLPCVTTTLLARQLGWQDRVQLLSADQPGSFADSCLDLLRDRTVWESVRKAALDAVATECSPDRFRNVLLELVSH
ncbi:MAG: glycosyltransferase [Pseudomonadales bacterium]|nr:glycosyltransferase [Pseudomonadales bacterium]